MCRLSYPSWSLANFKLAKGSAGCSVSTYVDSVRMLILRLDYESCRFLGVPYGILHLLLRVLIKFLCLIELYPMSVPV